MLRDGDEGEVFDSRLVRFVPASTQSSVALSSLSDASFNDCRFRFKESGERGNGVEGASGGCSLPIVALVVELAALL
jgi:hypothetical protein